MYYYIDVYGIFTRSKDKSFCHVRQALHADGFRSLAVVLKHAAIFPDNEQAVGQVARELGFTQVNPSVPAYGLHLA